jgi:hypothetical protein
MAFHGDWAEFRDFARIGQVQSLARIGFVEIGQLLYNPPLGFVVGTGCDN